MWAVYGVQDICCYRDSIIDAREDPDCYFIGGLQVQLSKIEWERSERWRSFKLF